MNDKQNQFNSQQQHSQTDSSQPFNAPEVKKTKSSLPPDWYTLREKGFNGSVYLSILVEERSQALVCLLGYGLLVLSLVDYLHIVIPLHFTDPAWEFQTIEALVDHAAPPLLGLVFVFYRREGYIKELEKNLLKLLSWISLLIGLLYLLIIPLGIADTWRIYYNINAQISTQFSQQNQQFQHLKDNLNQANTDKQIEQVLGALAPQGRLPEIKQPQEAKDQVLSQIAKAEYKLKTETDSRRSSQIHTLLKDSVKSHLGALIAGALFIWVWQFTDWARNA